MNSLRDANHMQKKVAKAIGLFTCIAQLVWSVSAGAVNEHLDRETGTLNQTPRELEGIGITEHLGSQVNLDLPFVDDEGRNVTLRQYVNGTKPVILDLAYYNCPSLCNFHLNGLNDALKKLKWTTGKEYEFVVVSINPNEKPPLAQAKKANYLNAYGRVEGASGWHFLTGNEAQIQELAREVGFKYRWDEPTKQYAHVSSAYVLTPEGKIARYLRGIYYAPQTVRLALTEASDGRISGVVDNLLLYCFHFDPKSNKYVLAAFNIMRAGGALTVLLIIAFLAPYWIRQRRQELANKA